MFLVRKFSSSERPIRLSSPEMKIGGIEVARHLKGLPVRDLERAAVQGDQPLASQVLENAVHVNGREAQRVAEFALGHRQFIAALAGKTDRLQTHLKLAEEVGDTLRG